MPDDLFWLSWICLLLIPLLGLLAGFIMLRYAPDHLGTPVGFRTSRAMQNGETWRFANTTAGRLLVRFCIFLAAVSAVLPFLFRNAGTTVFDTLTAVLLVAQVCTIAACLEAAQIMVMRRFPRSSRKR